MSEASSKSNSKTSKGKTFDVSRPGKSAPSATSRPVIIGHGPIIQDPMVQADQKNDDRPIDLPPKPMRSNAEKMLAAPESLTASVAKEAPEIEPSEENSPEPVQPEAGDSTEDSSTSDEAVVDSIAEQAADKKQQSEADQKAAEQATRIADLIEKKTYFVPINVAKHRRSNRMAIAALLTLVALVLSAGAVYVSGAF